ncbi:MAG: hypothetical protein ACYC5Q_08795 [Thermoleophilia bacterium]
MSAESITDWVKQFTPTFACWDLLECVHARRPNNATAESLGSLVGRSIRDIEPALDHLVGCGMLRRRFTLGGDALYTYAPTPEVAARAEAMLVKMPQHEVRVQVVTAILSVNAGGGRSGKGLFSQLPRRWC